METNIIYVEPIKNLFTVQTLKLHVEHRLENFKYDPLLLPAVIFPVPVEAAITPSLPFR